MKYVACRLAGIGPGALDKLRVATNEIKTTAGVANDGSSFERIG